MPPLRGRGSVGCALGFPAGEECECFSGASVAIRSPAHKEGLVGVTGQMQGLVVDFQRTDDGVAEAFVAPGPVEDLVLRTTSGRLDELFPGPGGEAPTPTPRPEPSADLVAAALLVCGLACVVW